MPLRGIATSPCVSSLAGVSSPSPHAFVASTVLGLTFVGWVVGCGSDLAPDAGFDAAQPTADAGVDADDGGGVRLDGDAGGNDGGTPDGGREGECSSHAACADGVYCNGAEICVDGSCRAGVPIDCDDGVECTGDGCAEPLRRCQSIPSVATCSSGEVCRPADGCVMVACSDDVTCDDGFVCNGVERCAEGLCAPGASLCTAPTDPCVTSLCVEPTGLCATRGRDADRDGYVDWMCGGVDCDDSRSDLRPGLAELCDGRGLDEDCDGWPDCADREDCVLTLAPYCALECQEEPESACHNGRDDDCNGLADCGEDPWCLGQLGCPDEVCPECPSDGCTAFELLAAAAPYASFPDLYMMPAAVDNTSGTCGGAGGADVAFAYTVRDAGTYVFSTAGSDYDTVLYVLDGSVPACAGAELACNADVIPETYASLTMYLEAGREVIITIDAQDGAAPGRIRLSVWRDPPPGTELCGNGADDDADGLRDCLDPDCAAFAECGALP